MTRRALVPTLTWNYAWGCDALWVVAAVSALLFLYSAFYASPNARLIAAQQRHHAAVQESRAFCEKTGNPVLDPHAYLMRGRFGGHQG